MSRYIASEVTHEVNCVYILSNFRHPPEADPPESVDLLGLVLLLTPRSVCSCPGRGDSFFTEPLMHWTGKQACAYLGISHTTPRRIRAESPDQLGACKPRGEWRYPIHRIKLLATPVVKSVRSTQ